MKISFEGRILQRKFLSVFLLKLFWEAFCFLDQKEKEIFLGFFGEIIETGNPEQIFRSLPGRVKAKKIEKKFS